MGFVEVEEKDGNESFHSLSNTYYSCIEMDVEERIMILDLFHRFK